MTNPENASPFPSEIQPGTVIELDDITELAVFEDAIAPFINPRYNQETGRPAGH